MQRAWLVASVGVFLVIGVSVLAVPALAQNCPELIGHWPYGPSLAGAVAGNYAYFGSGKALMVADISNPADPVRRSATSAPPAGAV